MKNNISEYLRKEFLKALYKQYGDLPKDIFCKIVNYKTSEKNRVRKPVLNKDCIGSLLWMNNHINKIRQEVEKEKFMDRCREKDSMYFWNDRRRLLEEQLYSLETEKRKMLMRYKYSRNF